MVDSFAEEGESSWQPGGGPMSEEPFAAPGPPAAWSPAAASPVPDPVRPLFADEDGEPFDAEEFFNPYSGPPEGADAWLAQVASPVADAYLAGVQPPAAGGPEALAAGFTHRDRVAGARGFAAGGLLDTMAPGPVLAAFAEDAIGGGGLPALSDDELAGVMGAARRLASRAAAIELAAVAGLNSRRAAAARATGDWRQHRHVGDEIAAALRLTCRAADKLLDLATGVTRLPAVAAALAAGRIDLPRATVYHHELAALGDVPAVAVAAVTITDAGGDDDRSAARRAAPGGAGARPAGGQKAAREGGKRCPGGIVGRAAGHRGTGRAGPAPGRGAGRRPACRRPGAGAAQSRRRGHAVTAAGEGVPRAADQPTPIHPAARQPR